MAPKIPPNPWQKPNRTEVIKIANVTLSNSLLNFLKNIPLNKVSSMIGDNITTVMKYNDRTSPLMELKSPKRGESKLIIDNPARYLRKK